MNKLLISFLLSLGIYSASAQNSLHFTTTNDQVWQQSKTSLSGKAATKPVISITGTEKGHEFRAWGTCFNELGLDALRLLSDDDQQEVMRNVFSPEGELKFTRGRLTMNANDYSRAWYSCDTVPGDFQLRYFNIEHDKQNVIQLIHMAQRYQPELKFWVSPWSPPAWMKINQDYPVISSRYNRQPKEKDYMLFEGIGQINENEVMEAGQKQGVFPRRLAVQDYFIQDSRYLQAYADMFCRFIELYAEQNIPIDMVMYQNEAYSYSPYPGCAWTADGTIRFNRDYLVPTLAKKHPEVKAYIGTFNTNRLDYVEKIVDGLKDQVSGIGLQWEGRDILSELRKRYPDIHLISSESECGNGAMDWKAAEHTFHLLCDYVGKGCDEYFIWNFILADNGQSTWGWKQNALIQVDSKTRKHRYTGEYYAVKHFSNLVPPGSRMVAYKSKEETNGTPVVVFATDNGAKQKYTVVTANFTDEQQNITLSFGKRYLNLQLIPHSFHSITNIQQ